MTDIEKRNQQQIQIFLYNIHYLRKKHKLTKTKMAKICGISASSLTKIENGILPNISCDMLFRVSDYFKIPIKNLFYKLY